MEKRESKVPTFRWISVSGTSELGLENGLISYQVATSKLVFFYHANQDASFNWLLHVIRLKNN